MRRSGTIAGVAVALLLVGGVAVASIPDANGVINGCRKNSDGSLRVIDTAVTNACPSGWTRLNWSQTGPPGPAGPAGLSGYEVRFASAPTTGSAQVAVEVYCTAGKRALGGGGQRPSDPDPSVVWALSYSRPLTFPGNPTDPAVGWMVQAERVAGPSTTSGGVSAWVICAAVN